MDTKGRAERKVHYVKMSFFFQLTGVNINQLHLELVELPTLL